MEGVEYADEVLPDFIGNPDNRRSFAPLLPLDYEFPIDPTITRDFDNGLGNTADGAYFSKADDGKDRLAGDSRDPYFETEIDFRFDFAPLSQKHHFHPRIAISPVDFGSIPSASQANAPWTCLLFRPNLADPSTHPHLGEPGNGMRMISTLVSAEELPLPQMASVTGDPTLPPDHLWLDYFWMPTTEPEHVSSAFATQGKVNMNYQLFPYTYIHRATAMHAVLKAEEIMAIPTTAGQTYKTSQDNPDWQHRIDASETLKQFEERFAQGEIFITESEICEQFLIPEGEQWDLNGKSIRAFWDKHRLSGDNTLERPYSGLYARLTRRSNAFRLHYRVQTICKSDETATDVFDQTKDTVTADHRGSKVLERVLNSEDNFPSASALIHHEIMPRIEEFYHFEVRQD